MERPLGRVSEEHAEPPPAQTWQAIRSARAELFRVRVSFFCLGMRRYEGHGFAGLVTPDVEHELALSNMRARRDGLLAQTGSGGRRSRVVIAVFRTRVRSRWVSCGTLPDTHLDKPKPCSK